jgi:hypothetical protein
MTFELQEESESVCPALRTRFSALGKKKGRPEWTPFQKLGSVSNDSSPMLGLVRAKSHVESPSVMIEARNSLRRREKTYKSDAEVVAQACGNLCSCRKTCA